MYVSTETIAIVISAVSVMLGFVGAFGWMIHRMDAGFAQLNDRIDRVAGGLEHKLGARIDGVEQGLESRLNARIDRVEQGLEQRLGERIDRVEQGLEQRLGERIDRVEHGLGERLDRVEYELVEVKIAVARIEGPPRHLLAAR